MRLTLRTLLAYMDDILEPADHEDLGKKIEASDFASELIHRSRDTVRRLRLGAPAVLASGSDDVLDSINLSDANSVSEYLDNTLPPEKVADFERMCLEPGNVPDMHLAEVASCHHVLTMVLGEPAEVDAELKSRMYQLPAQLVSGQKLRIEPGHVALPVAPPQQSATTTAAPPMTGPASSVQADIPDYLRAATDSKRRVRRWAIAAAMLGVGAFSFWFLNPPEAELSSELTKSAAGSFDSTMDLEITGMGEAATTAPATDSDGVVAEAPPYVPGLPAATVEDATTLAPEIPATETEQPMLPDFDAAVEEDLAAGLELPTADPEIESTPAPETLSTAPAIASPEIEARAGSDKPGAPSVAGEAPSAGFPTTKEAPLALDTAKPAEPMPMGPQRLGSYLGNHDILLRHDAARDKWIRLPPRSAITTGDSLLALPKFRPHVVLADVNTYLAGGTRVQIPLEKFEASVNTNDLNLEVIYGRLLLNAGHNGSQIAMQIGDQLREFHLASSAGLAVDVHRIFVPGSDYENEAAAVEAVWYLTFGSVEWPAAAGGTQTIEAPAMWRTIDDIDEIPELIEVLPTWIDRESVTDVERIASADLAEELEVDQPVGLRLLELTDGKGIGRKKEVRILASASSVYVGEFEPLVKAINDSDQNRAWEAHIDDLRRALASSPDVAARVKQAFVNIRGEEAAADLMKMLVGFSRAEIGETREAIQNGELPRLLKWLDSDSLDYRLLAIRNLREITGKSKGYRPDDSSKRRKIALRKIWDQFESNELVPQS